MWGLLWYLYRRPPICVYGLIRLHPSDPVALRSLHFPLLRLLSSWHTAYQLDLRLEIIPQRTRNKGVAMGVGLHWLSNFWTSLSRLPPSLVSVTVSISFGRSSTRSSCQLPGSSTRERPTVAWKTWMISSNVRNLVWPKPTVGAVAARKVPGNQRFRINYHNLRRSAAGCRNRWSPYRRRWRYCYTPIMCSCIWHYSKGSVRGTALNMVGVVAFTFLTLAATRWREARVIEFLFHMSSKISCNRWERRYYDNHQWKANRRVLSIGR